MQYSAHQSSHSTPSLREMAMSNSRQRSLSSLKQASITSLVSSTIASESSFSLSASATAPGATASGGSIGNWEAGNHSSSSLFLQADGASRPYVMDRQPLGVRPSSMSSVPSFYLDDSDDNHDDDMAFTSAKDEDFQIPLRPMESCTTIGRGSNHKNEERQMLATTCNTSFNSTSCISVLTSASFGGGDLEDDIALAGGMKSTTLTVPLHSLQVGGVVQRPAKRRSKDRLQMSKLTSSLRSSSFHGMKGASNRGGMALVTEDLLEEDGRIGAPSLMRNSSWSGGLLTSSQVGGTLFLTKPETAHADEMIRAGNNDASSFRRQMMMRTSSIRGLLGSSMHDGGEEASSEKNKNNIESTACSTGKDLSSFRRQMMNRTSSIRGLLGSSQQTGRRDEASETKPITNESSPVSKASLSLPKVIKRQEAWSGLFGSSQHRDSGNDKDLDLTPPSSTEPEPEVHTVEDEDECLGDIPKHISMDSLEAPGEEKHSKRRGPLSREANNKRGAAHHKPYTTNYNRPSRSRSSSNITGSSLNNSQSTSSVTRNNSNTNNARWLEFRADGTTATSGDPSAISYLANWESTHHLATNG